MKSWLPVIVSFIIIAASIYILKFQPSPLPTLSIPVLTPTPTVVASSNQNNDYAYTYAKCGEIPNLSEYSLLRFPGEYSLKMWSPNCRFIAWSATIKYSFGQWSASKYEGLFLYDPKTKKTTRLYTPTSENDVVSLQNWQDDVHLIFHKNLENADFIYNLSGKTIEKI